MTLIYFTLPLCMLPSFSGTVRRTLLLSVCHTGDPCPNSSVPGMLCTTWQWCFWSFESKFCSPHFRGSPRM